jgi:hypothetical protein
MPQLPGLDGAGRSGRRHAAAQGATSLASRLPRIAMRARLPGTSKRPLSGRLTAGQNYKLHFRSELASTRRRGLALPGGAQLRTCLTAIPASARCSLTSATV